MIVPKVEFPDVHLGDLVGQQGAHQFKVKRGHTKLYIPELLLLTEADYQKQKEQERSNAHRKPSPQDACTCSF